MSLWSDWVDTLNPYSWYKLDEASGTTLIDSGDSPVNGSCAAANITHNQSGMIPGEPTSRSKISAAGAQMDTGIISMNVDADGISLIYTYKGTTANVVGNGEIFRTINSNGIRFGVNATDIIMHQFGNALTGWVMCDRDLLLDDTPHMVVLTFLDNDQRMYIDGALVGSTTATSGVLPTGTSIWRFCRNNAGNFLSGQYDDIVFVPYALSADDVDDGFDAWSNIPLSPDPTCGAATSTTLAFSWPAEPEADTYEVRINGGAENDIGNTLTHTFTGVTPGSTNTLEVRACSEGGCSDWASVQCTALPGPPDPVASDITQTGFTVCWEPAEGNPDTYEITIDGSDPATTTSCHVFEGLTPGTEYEVCVRSCLTDVGCSDYACITVTTLSPPAQEWSPCPCGPGWRIEVCNLRTGVIRGILLPTAMDFQVMKNTVGRGSLTLPVRDVRALDVWPDFTSVYITREGMDPANDDCLFAGIIRQVTGANGTVQVGMDSIESYLWRRRLLRDLTFTGIGQNQIAAALVAETVANGIPLTGSAQTPGTTRNRDYLTADRAYIGPLLEQFTESVDGPSWRLEHSRTGGAWSTRIVFADTVGDDRDTVLVGDREGTDYGLDLNSQDHATWIDGFNQADPPLTSHVDDLSIYPAFDADPTFDAPLQVTLDEQTQGYLNVRGDIAATPSFQLSGEAITAAQMRLGDTAEFHLDQGFIAFHGRAAVGAITYRVAEGSPLTRDLALIPVDSAVESVMNATSTDQCQSCR